MMTSAKTQDAPLTGDGLLIAATLPPGRYELRETTSGVLVVRTDSTVAHTARDEALRTSGESLKRMAVAAGGGQHAR